MTGDRRRYTRREVLASGLALGAVGAGAGLGARRLLDGDGSAANDAGEHSETGDAGGEFPPDEGTAYGRAVRLGGGTVRPFTTATDDGSQYHGVEFERGALSGLADADELAAADAGAATDKYRATGQVQRIHRRWSRGFFVPFPPAADSAVTFLGLNWNPAGHPGAGGAWEVPHFDVHFHTLDPATIDAIEGPRAPPYDGIPDEQVPAGYARPPDPSERYVTDMGEHLAPGDAPEIPGNPDAFDVTLIQGVVGVGTDGATPQWAFVEPMVTREYLRGIEGTETFDVPHPATVPTDGRYPTEYSVRDVPGAETVCVTVQDFE